MEIEVTNKLVCHENGNGTYILLRVSLSGQTGHLTNHAGDYVPNSPECQPETPPTTVVEVTTVPTTTLTTGTSTNVSTDTTVQSQIDTQVLHATVAVPGPVPYQGPLPATGGGSPAGALVALAMIGAGGVALAARRFRRA
jgi:LPXTG-motif cell wall-anchored protein